MQQVLGGKLSGGIRSGSGGQHPLGVVEHNRVGTGASLRGLRCARYTETGEERHPSMRDGGRWQQKKQAHNQGLNISKEGRDGQTPPVQTNKQ